MWFLPADGYRIAQELSHKCHTAKKRPGSSLPGRKLRAYGPLNQAMAFFAMSQSAVKAAGS